MTDRPIVSRRSLVLAGLGAAVLPNRALAAGTYRPMETQFMAAIGDPLARQGDNADIWGLWTKDPGPRGVRLANYEALLANKGVAPAEWTFDAGDWWLEEHGLIMEQPIFGISPGKYVVTGDRSVMTTLTIAPRAADGKQHWELANGAVLYDVTHLRCRSARYRPAQADKACTPAKVAQDGFPVEPGAAMPPVNGCIKQDYAVLFVVGMET